MPWQRLREKRTRLIVGLVSGTSVDGIDAALVQVSGDPLSPDIQLLGFREAPFSSEVRKAIFAAFRPESSGVDHLCRLNYALGHLFADAALNVIHQCGLTPADVDLIGFAGQTVYHIPEPEDVLGIATGSTLQLGEAAVVAERTRIPVVGELYTRDVAAGGKGAPLSPFGDYVMFRGLNKPVAVHNIGGIANVTAFPAGAAPEQVIGFDTGPGNMVIDAIVRYVTDGNQQYDRDGALAAAGAIHNGLLSELMDDPYFSAPPPKATGRERYGEQYARHVLDRARAYGVGGADLVATVTALTAASIALNYERFVLPRVPVSEIILAGGGAYNPTLRRFIQERLPGLAVRTFEDYGYSSKAREAIAFALIANATVAGVPNNLPSVTGAQRPVVLGKLVPA
ncbi:MAG TPA: anhydro-N-acetylmuramic acid kinase [Limnochordales bacterium]